MHKPRFPAFTEADRDQLKQTVSDWGHADDAMYGVLIALSGKELDDAATALMRAVTVLIRSAAPNEAAAKRGASAWATDFVASFDQLRMEVQKLH